MKTKINPDKNAKPKTAKARRPMTYILWALLGTVLVASVAFLLLLFRLSLEDADFWLRPMTAVVLFVTFVAGGAGLATGYFAGKKSEERILELSQTLEEERRTRLELEADVAPRRLKQMGDLKAFAGTTVQIYSVPDFEARRLAEQIRQSLEAADWEVRVFTVIDDFRFPDGIVIEFEERLARTTPRDVFPARDAASALKAQLRANNIEAAAARAENSMALDIRGFKTANVFPV